MRFLIWAALLPSALFGATREQNLLRHLHDNVEMMRHELRNHEEEIRTLQEKVRNQDETIVSLSRDLEEARELAADSSERRGQMLASDMEKLKRHADDSSSALEGFHEKFTEMEKRVVGHQENIAHLKEAMRSLTDAFNPAEGETAEGYRLYRVKSGDSLGVIAQKYNTTVKEIKALNDLKNSTIIIGQKLKIPEQK